MRKYCLALLMPFVAMAADVIKNQGNMVISNGILEAHVQLNSGGRVIRLVDLESGVDFTSGESLPGGCGLFSESPYDLVSKDYDKRYENSQYAVVSFNKGDTASLVLRSPGDLPLEVNKTYTLKDGSRELQVEYELINRGEKDFIGGFRVGNAIRVKGVKKYGLQFPRGYRNNDWIPAGEVRDNAFDYVPGTGNSADIFVHSPDRAYATVSAASQTLKLTANFPMLKFFYSYQSGDAYGYAIVDEFSDDFQLQPISKGEKEVELLAVLDDPLAAYKLRLKYSICVYKDVKDYASLGGPSTEKKENPFAIRQESSKLFTDFDTPAIIRVASPARPLRVLAIGNACGNAELGELGRRFGYELEIVDTANNTSFVPSKYFGWKMPRCEGALREALEKRPEVIIVCGNQDKSIPKDLLDMIGKLVDEGTGLIFIGQYNEFSYTIPNNGAQELPPDVYAGTLMETLPKFGDVKVYSRGAGKMIHVGYNMIGDTRMPRDARVIIPYVRPYPSFPYWETIFAFYGKMIRYASGKDGVGRITGVEVKEDSIAYSLHTSREAMCTLKGIVESSQGRSEVKDLGVKALVNGDAMFTQSLPKDYWGAGGKQIIRVMLEVDGHGEDWFDVEKDFALKDCIASIEPSKATYAKNTVIDGVIRINGNGVLALSLVECVTGRVVAKQQLGAVSGEVKFALKREVSCSEKAFDIVAELQSKGNPKPYRLSKTVLIKPDEAYPDFIRPLVWGPHLASWRDLEFFQELADVGFRVYKSPLCGRKHPYDFRHEAEWALRNGMEFAPLSIEHVHSENSEDKIVRNPCLRNPAYLEKLHGKTMNMADKMRETLSDWCYVEDEVTLSYRWGNPHNYCMSPYCMAEFRKIMREKYNGNLDELNANWKTSFKDWDEVKPYTLEEARAIGAYASVIEHRYFMMGNITLAFKQIADDIKNVCGAETGISGMAMTEVYQGYDLLDTMEFMLNSANYVNPFSMDAIRCAMTPSHRTGAYTDYGPRYQVWSQLISGLRTPCVWWYAHCARRGDSKLSEEGELLRKIFASVRESGAEYILEHGQRRRSPICVLWSTQALVGALALGENSPITHKTYNENLAGWAQLLRDMGMDAPDVLDIKKLESVSPATHPILLMPMAVLLTDKQVDMLERYVQDGGVLIADLVPGVYDGKGMLRQDNPMWKLFGCRPTGKQLAGLEGNVCIEKNYLSGLLKGAHLKLDDDAVKCGEIKNETKGLDFAGIHIENDASGNAPVAVTRKVGKGRTLYMNFAPYRYLKDGSTLERVGRPLVESMRRIFAEAELPVGRLNDMPMASEFAEFQLSGNRYLFVMRKPSMSTGAFKLPLGGTYAVYDMFHGKYLGTQDAIAGILKENEVGFFACVPKELGKFESKVKIDGRYATVTARQKGDNEALVRVIVKRNGREIRQLSRVYPMKGKLELKVDLGLEAKDDWEVSVVRLMNN